MCLGEIPCWVAVSYLLGGSFLSAAGVLLPAVVGEEERLWAGRSEDTSPSNSKVGPQWIQSAHTLIPLTPLALTPTDPSPPLTPPPQGAILTAVLCLLPELDQAGLREVRSRLAQILED